MTRLAPAGNSQPADWVVAGLRGFGESVLSVVPGGFPVYVRIFHPAYRHPWEKPTPVRWTEIAAANGTHVHAAMQLTPLTGRGARSRPRTADDDTGSTLVRSMERLRRYARRHTPER